MRNFISFKMSLSLHNYVYHITDFYWQWHPTLVLITSLLTTRWEVSPIKFLLGENVTTLLELVGTDSKWVELMLRFQQLVHFQGWIILTSVTHKSLDGLVVSIGLVVNNGLIVSDGLLVRNGLVVSKMT